jgi:hypothetical protein
MFNINTIGMFIKSLLPMILVLATQLLNEKRDSKVVKWLMSDEVQNTVGTFFAAYMGAVSDYEQNNEG